MLFNAGANGSGPDLWFVNGAFTWNDWDSSGSYNQFGAQPNDTVGNWHHYAVVNDPTTPAGVGEAHLYIDGVYFGSTRDTNRSTMLTTFTIGAGGINSYGFDGAIDDVSVYDEALTAAQIANLYQTGSTGNVPDGGATLALLGLSLFGVGAAKRRLGK